jgi:spore germination protein YaaH
MTIISAIQFILIRLRLIRMFKTVRLFITLIIPVLLALPVQQVTAQSTTNGPIYVVQEGDSLWDIAYRFHVTQDALARANGIIDTNQIKMCHLVNLFKA